MENTSIVYTHWAMNPERSRLMQQSFQSLLDTAPDAEIIVVDNGGSSLDSLYFLKLCHEGKIASYTRYRSNMHFAYARNDGLRRASREYIAVSDNDIVFQPGWLEECVQWLKDANGKFLATPIQPDPMNAARPGRWVGEVHGWKLNTRAGSNIWVMHRDSFQEIGPFEIHHIAGSLWCDRYRGLGYAVGVMPVSKAKDMALREGYNIKEKITQKTL
jgi:glycosyltransferase involved in cell wall biosynthesis